MNLDFAVQTLTTAQDELWDSILDLSALLDEGSWVLAGDQAVLAHSLATGVLAPERAATGELLGRLVTTNSAINATKRNLGYLGFEPEADQHPVLRFTRPADGAELRAQTWEVHVVGRTHHDGGDQALARRIPYQASKGMRTTMVPVPDMLSSLVYEAARFCSDTVSPFTHARDAAHLVSILDDPIAQRTRLTPADRRYLRALDAAVGHAQHSIWAALPAERDAYTRWRLLLAV